MRFLHATVQSTWQQQFLKELLHFQNKNVLIIYSPPCHPRCPCLPFFSHKSFISRNLSSETICHFLNFFLYMCTLINHRCSSCLALQGTCVLNLCATVQDRVCLKTPNNFLLQRQNHTTSLFYLVFFYYVKGVWASLHVHFVNTAGASAAMLDDFEVWSVSTYPDRFSSPQESVVWGRGGSSFPGHKYANVSLWHHLETAKDLF